jgi:hypothetical protein
MQKYDTRRVLAAAILAFDTNQSVVKESCFKADESSSTGLQEVIANKILIRQYVTDHADQITDQLLERADYLVNYIQQAFMMQTLIAPIMVTDFMSTMHALVLLPAISERELGLAAWAPKFASDLAQRESVRNEMSLYIKSSKYLSEIDKKITVDFKLISKKYYSKKNIHFVTGHDNNGNLVSFWANKITKVIESGSISGRVAKHYTDERGAKHTQLRYVKIL